MKTFPFLKTLILLSEMNIPFFRILKRPLLLWLVGSISFGILTAQKVDELDFTDLSLEDLMSIDLDSVIGASRYKQKISEAPSTISILTRKEFQRYGYSTVIEAINSLHGFYQSYDRNYDYVGVRGFSRAGDYNSRLLMVIDGQRAADSLYDAGVYGNDGYVDLGLVERIEVVRGPSSSVYGSNAFFGVVNIITRSPASIGGVETALEAASYDSYRVRLTYGNEFENGLGLLISANIYDSAGPSELYFPEFDDPLTNNGIAQNGDDEYSKQAFLKLQFHELTLSAAYTDREKGFPTASYDTVFNDPRNRTWDEVSYANLAYDTTFDNDLHLTARLSYNEYDYFGEYLYDWSDEGDLSYLVPNQDFALASWWGAEAHLSRELLDGQLTLSGGFEYRDNYNQDQSNFDQDGEDRYLYIDSREESDVWGLYAQADYKLNETVRLTGGIRHDHYDSFGGTTNPRLGLIYQAADPTTVKFLYGTAFRAPNGYELFFEDDGLSQKLPMGLEPETIDTFEVVLEHQFNEQYRASVSVFHNEIDDLISLVTDPEDELLIFENLDNAESTGFELEFQANHENGLISRASYSWQETEDTLSRETLSNSPEHMAKFNLSAPVYGENTFAGIELQYVSSRKTLAGEQTGDSFLVNATLFSGEVSEDLELSITIRNLFDEEYGYPGSEEHIQDIIYQNGRTFSGKLSWRF